MYLNNYQSFIFGTLIIGLLSFVACEKTTEISKILGFGGKAELMQTDSIWFGTDSLTGIKVSVTEIADSRCPEDVQCVWAGEANVDVLASYNEESIKLKLKIDPAKSSKTDTVNFTLNSKNYKALLFAVNPYPNTKIKAVKVATITVLNTN